MHGDCRRASRHLFAAGHRGSGSSTRRSMAARPARNPAGLASNRSHALNPQQVLIHDAARPFVSPDLIDRVIGGLAHHPCVIPGLPVGDTIKRAPGGIVAGTVDRADLWSVQTPQGFEYPADPAGPRAGCASRPAALTDDAAVAERAGIRVAIVLGAAENRKLTTPHDIEEADSLPHCNAPWLGLPDVRVGQGFDVHKFGAGDSVTCWAFASTTIPSDWKAIPTPTRRCMRSPTPFSARLAKAISALTFRRPTRNGTARNRAYFSSTRSQFGVGKGGVIAHVDITILAEAPRIAPHIAAMKEQLGQMLHLHPSRTSPSRRRRRRRLASSAVARASPRLQRQPCDCLRADRHDDRR